MALSYEWKNPCILELLGDIIIVLPKTKTTFKFNSLWNA
jgi:hypothetical protein